MFDGIPQVMYILIMKITKHLIIESILLALFLSACASTKVAETPAEQPAPTTVEVSSPAVTEEPATSQVPVDDEYSRSVGNLTVSKDTFEADKAEIISIIDKLSTIMRDFDYQSWLLYVDKESQEYWSRPTNLKKAQGKLPVKGLRLNTLQDYFKYVFVPSRAGRVVTEIRYVSDTYVKAVQVTAPATPEEEEKFVIYYYFNKIQGHWELHLPEIDG